MIYPYVFTRERDAEMLAVLIRSLAILGATAKPTIFAGREEKQRLSNRTLAFLEREGCKVVMRRDGFTAEGWPSGTRHHVDAIEHMLSVIGPNDHTGKIDDDVVFARGDVFKHIIENQAQLAGAEHGTYVGETGNIEIYPNTRFQTERFGDWGHCQGNVQLVRGDIAAKIPSVAEAVHKEMVKYDICMTEDVGLSYLAWYCGARNTNLIRFPSGEVEPVLEGLLTNDPLPRGYCHYTGIQRVFNASIPGKWNILTGLRAVRPDIVNKLGLDFNTFPDA